jgi:Pyrimidine dimer DNA glycosylase
MQTFLPYESYQKSAKILDRQRLGKQRVETLQILNALSNPDYGWQNHPAVNMWRGYEFELVVYGIAICKEWISRGYKDTCLQKISCFADTIPNISIEVPEWIGNEDLHKSHRSNLLRKNPEYYGKLFEQGLVDDLEYVWP